MGYFDCKNTGIESALQDLAVFHGAKDIVGGERLKIKIFNREICVCALLATNSFMRKKQRRNGENHDR